MKKRLHPAGFLIGIGGGEDKGENAGKSESPTAFNENGILKTMVELMNSPEPIIEIITTATGYPNEAYGNYLDAFTALGCMGVAHLNIRDRAAANSADTIERVRKCHGVMFTGGDQTRLCAVLGGTALHHMLRDRYLDEHFVIAGTSAGATAMSATMIQGGKVEKAFHKGEVRLSVGLGFITDVIIDTHFDARGRFARLAQAVAAQPGIIGIGLSEDTAVVVQNGNTIRAIGSGDVTTIDGSFTDHNNIAEISTGMAISIANLRVNLMAQGDVFDLTTKEFTGAVKKK